MKKIEEIFTETTNSTIKLEMRYVEEFGVLACWMPSTGCSFNADNLEDASETANRMTKVWISFYKKKNGQPTSQKIESIKDKSDIFTLSAYVDINFDLRYTGEEGGFSFYIPMTDGSYSASSIEEGKRRASIMIRAFIDFWKTRSFVS